MKKYVKPDLVYESFAMTNNIALGCGIKTNHDDTDQTCATEDIPGIGIFFVVPGDSCNVKYDDKVEIFDYQGGKLSIFAS
ncbi:MAG: hypothetical protein MJ175_05080 [Clostridia bacterium]|nr:hypothetical protein [Clostridia bacterium]